MIWLAVLALLLPSQAWAGELFLDAGAGVTAFHRTISDGTWIQEHTPYTQTMTSFSYKAGLTYQASERWGYHLTYLNAGVAKIRGHAVSDEQYHSSTFNPLNARPFNTHDLYEGAALTVSYSWYVQAFRPYVKLGGAGIYHRLTAQFNDAATGNSLALTTHGWIPMSVIGAGVGWGWLYAEGEYYRGFGGSLDNSAGLPISKEFLLATAGVRIPLWR